MLVGAHRVLSNLYLLVNLSKENSSMISAHLFYFYEQNIKSVQIIIIFKNNIIVNAKQKQVCHLVVIKRRVWWPSRTHIQERRKSRNRFGRCLLHFHELIVHNFRRPLALGATFQHRLWSRDYRLTRASKTSLTRHAHNNLPSFPSRGYFRPSKQPKSG